MRSFSNGALLMQIKEKKKGGNRYEKDSHHDCEKLRKWRKNTG